jgi:hypothetical protein
MKMFYFILIKYDFAKRATSLLILLYPEFLPLQTMIEIWG